MVLIVGLVESQNFGLYKDLNVNVTKSFAVFMGFEGTDYQMLRLKFRNADVAGQFRDAVTSCVSDL